MSMVMRSACCPPPSLASRRITSNASASMRNGAAASPGVGTAWLFCVLDVSTDDRAEKKPVRDGRRWRARFLSVEGAIECSTVLLSPS